MKKIIRLLDLLHACRLHLPILYAVIALSLAKASGIPMNANTFVVVASFCCALIFAYLFNRVTDRNQDVRVCALEAVSQKNIFLFLAAAVVAAFSGAGLLLANGSPLLPYVVYLILGALYSVRIAGFQIRKAPLLKNLTAAGAWFSSFGVILWILKPSLTIAWFTRGYLYVFFMILAYELLWDIRDAEADREAGVGTIPALWGLPAGRGVAASLVATAFILSRSAVFSITGLNLALLAVFAVFTPTSRPRLFHVPLYAQAAFSLLSLLPK